MKMRRHGWWRWDLQPPHIILAMFLGLAILYGSHVNAENTKRQCAGQVYALRVILQEIHPEPGADAGLIATIRELNAAYARQYQAIYEFIDGDQCVGMLPKDAPPPLTVP